MSKNKKNTEANDKSLESWIWDAACAIRGAKDAPKYKEYILPLIFAKRLCDVFDDELNRIATEVGSREKAFRLVEVEWRRVADKKKAMVRFYLPLKPKDTEQPVWSVIRKLSDKIGEGVTTHMREIARENPLLKGIIDRVDFNATTHGQRDLDDDRLSNLIEAISTKRLGLEDGEADIIGKSYEYLIRKFAEGSGQSAGEFYTPGEVGEIMARVLAPDPGMEIYDPTCGSGGLLIKCELAMEAKIKAAPKTKDVRLPLKLFGQEYVPETWAMANMNMIIHDMEGQIEIGDAFKNPRFRAEKSGKLRTFDRVVANPMWNQDWYVEADYDNDELDRFPAGAGFPGKSSAGWGWVQHMSTSLNASRIFEKGDPKNFIPPEGIARIAGILIKWKEEEKLSRIVDHAELQKNDYNISPSRYIHTGDAETYRPLAEIVAELNIIEAEARETDKALRTILKQIGI
ncbi:MAG: SAM-dependent DNA methyltransferase [Nitrospira sp. SB0675_bin_23]|nr:SAM-dependent DNA methyltransferase [Nitrospira sp. SB0675_bin_23]